MLQSRHSVELQQQRSEFSTVLERSEKYLQELITNKREITQDKLKVEEEKQTLIQQMKELEKEYQTKLENEVKKQRESWAEAEKVRR